MLNASGIEVKLSQAQQRAYDKLTDKWECAYILRERLDTLDILEDKELAESHRKLGAGWYPRTEIYYRKKVYDG